MADDTQVLLSILLDKSAQADVERGLDTIAKKTGELDKAASQTGKNVGQSWDAMGNDFEKFTQQFDQRFKAVNGKLIDFQTGTKASADTLREFTRINVDAPAKDAAKIAAEMKRTAEEVKRAKAEERALNREMEAVAHTAGITVDQVRELPEPIYQAGVRAAQLGQHLTHAHHEYKALQHVAMATTQIFQPLLIGGTAFVGAIALAARNYVKFIEDSGIRGDETANKWIAATAKVKNAQLNLGQTSAQVLLPVYQQLAQIMTRAAEFANAHPDALKAGLSIGAVVATVGAIGTLVAKGIQLYADVKLLTATAQFELATANFQKSVEEFLTGSTLAGPKAAAGTAAAGAGGLVGTLAGPAIAIAVGVTIAKAVVDAVSQGLAQTDFGKQIDEAQRKAAENGKGYPGINRYARETEKADKAAESAAQSTEQLADGLRDFQKEATMVQATNAYVQYRQQEAQAEKQYMAQREQIVQQGAAQLAQIETNYTQQRVQLAQQYASQSAQALSNFNYQQAQALEQFNRNETRAVEEYNQNRKQAREEYQKEERQSAQDHQREMRRLEEESQDKQRDLIAARDALGLVRERRDLARRQREAEEDFNVERQRRRQEIRQRLKDLDEQFQQERARRQEDFAYQQAQAQEQFNRQQEQARQQYEERLKQLDEQHRQEIEKTRQQTADKLREIELQYRQEQITRRNAFYDILRDLDANLLNERELRQAYYQQMQTDLQNFLNSATVSGAGSNLPGYASGGYTPAGGGAIRTHPDEWVADKETTRALERMVGGKLTQESVRSLTSSSQTVNLSFPGGLVTIKMLRDVLKENNAGLLQQITKGLLG